MDLLIQKQKLALDFDTAYNKRVENAEWMIKYRLSKHASVYEGSMVILG